MCESVCLGVCVCMYKSLKERRSLLFSCMILTNTNTYKSNVCSTCEGIKGDNSQLLNYLSSWGHASVEKWRQTRSICTVPLQSRRNCRTLFRENMYWFYALTYTTSYTSIFGSQFSSEMCMGEKSLVHLRMFSLFFYVLVQFWYGKHWTTDSFKRKTLKYWGENLRTHT